MAYTLVVVPIYWGAKWLPPSDKRMRRLSFTLLDLNSAMWTIMRSWYMLGLKDYGILPGTVHTGYAIQDPADPSPQDFDPATCWAKINDVIAAGHVPQPDAWGDDHKVLYSLFLEPGSACSDPNIFGENDKQHLHVWVTANSDLAGAIDTYAHEMVEGSSGDEIADPCKPNTVVIDGLRLPTYHSKTLNACWPTEEALLLHRGFLTIDQFKGLKDKPIKIGP
jgi:hypothetical protein